jgi:hypothetical protein
MGAGLVVKRMGSLAAGIGMFLQSYAVGGFVASHSAKSAELHSAKSAELRSANFAIQFVGMHTLSPTRHWPALRFGSIRPAGASWGAIEPAKAQFDWHSLDTWAAEAQRHHVRNVHRQESWLCGPTQSG